MLKESQGSGGQKEIVIIEDDDLLRSLAAEIVAELGMPCRCFSNCDDALIYRLEAGPCFAIIVDHGVPGQIQGTEFLAMHHEHWPDVPAILMSGYDLRKEELPPNAVYLQKPWSAEVMIQTLKGFLSGVYDLPPADDPHDPANSLHVRPQVPEGPQ
ncbi:hypothetical protein A210_17780 [Pseudomonas putida SJTE-1]|uniref:response regulator n=1 Tax=Pseudomonas putida TaxID=303 RepID=UPI0007DDF3FD|nr:response regulator [Pseudomonas putida]ANI04423.1 hypothetical protein A210_17780 [Pseudomonas putida SJTE-1]